MQNQSLKNMMMARTYLNQSSTMNYSGLDSVMQFVNSSTHRTDANDTTTHELKMNLPPIRSSLDSALYENLKHQSLLDSNTVTKSARKKRKD